MASTGGDVEADLGVDHYPVNNDQSEALLQPAAARAATAPATAMVATEPGLLEFVEQFQAKQVRANTDFAAAATDQHRRV